MRKLYITLGAAVLVGAALLVGAAVLASGWKTADPEGWQAFLYDCIRSHSTATCREFWDAGHRDADDVYRFSRR